MAYATYITDALVCASRDSNTSDRAYLLFAREAGMVWATARSVREERSKQRYALQDFSRVRATLVRGKAGWRIAGVEPTSNLYYDAESRPMRTVVRNTLRLLKRILQGEEAHQALFDDVMKQFELLKLVEAPVADLETVVALRILAKLGYVAADARYDSVLKPEYSIGAGLEACDVEFAKKAVTRALESSQL